MKSRVLFILIAGLRCFGAYMQSGFYTGICKGGVSEEKWGVWVKIELDLYAPLRGMWTSTWGALLIQMGSIARTNEGRRTTIFFAFSPIPPLGGISASSNAGYHRRKLGVKDPHWGVQINPCMQFTESGPLQGVWGGGGLGKYCASCPIFAGVVLSVLNKILK